MPKYLINIVGPTAIGKTALAVQIAQHFQTEIISADSRQFYKEMAIGTAVPEAEELAAAPHHFIQHISIEDSYNVGDFEKDALATLKELHQKNDVVVLVGGSGLYTKALTQGLDEFPEVDREIRENLNQHLENDGLDWLQKKLYVLDPEYYKNADVQNPHRVIRALEICIGTNKPFSTFLNQGKAERDFETINLGLTADRTIIYDRINRRVDLMMENGLLNEAESLYPKRELNALNTVGYKEMFSYLDNEIDLETAISEIKKNTRRFAKRQLTWFRKTENIEWFDYDYKIEEVLNFVASRINT